MSATPSDLSETAQPPSIPTVRIANNWAILTASGKYVDAGAVQTVNGIVISLLVLLTLFWIGVGSFQIYTGLNLASLNEGLYTQIGTLYAYGVTNIVISLLHLVGVKEIVAHAKNVVWGIRLLCLIGAAGGILQLALNQATLQLIPVPIYLMLAFLIGVNGEFFKRQ